MKCDDWLWRLRSIWKEMEHCPALAEVRVVFTLKVHHLVASTEELKTFPFGRVIAATSSIASKFDHPDTGALWFDLGRGAFPFALCWDWNEGWSCHRLMPKEFFPKDKEGAVPLPTLGWCRWYYYDRKTKIHKKGSFDQLSSQLGDLEEAILEACSFAPAPVTERLGDLSQLGCWPTALFYLALQRTHPLLSAFGTHVPKQLERHGTEDTSFGALNDRVIFLSPDWLTATKYAFDAMRRLAKDGGRHGEVKAGGRTSRRTPQALDSVPFATPEGATWESVAIRFLDGERVSVNVEGATGIFNYTHLGMADGRHAGANLQWKLLESFARGRGVLDWEHSDARRENQKRRETLAKNLRVFFGIKGDPFIAEGNGWRARFAVSSGE